jgi:hypothetical protein
MPAIYNPDLTLNADAPAMFDADGADRETPVGRVRYPGTINSVEFIPGWTQTGAATNNRTFTLFNRRTNGTGTTAVASLLMTSAQSLTRFVPVSLSISSAGAAVVPGDILVWESLHIGSGLPDVGGRIVVQQSVTY